MLTFFLIVLSVLFYWEGKLCATPAILILFVYIFLSTLTPLRGCHELPLTSRALPDVCLVCVDASQSVCLPAPSDIAWHTYSPPGKSTRISICDASHLTSVPFVFFKTVTPPPPLPVSFLLGYAVSFLRTHSIQNSATEVNRCFLYYINISFELCLLCFLRYDNLLFFYFCFSSSSYSQHIITDILTSNSHN